MYVGDIGVADAGNANTDAMASAPKTDASLVFMVPPDS
ncbi:hypothetical protein NOCA1260025 [metagenome]|uniref:Uncharacterized protein n=1 Tax=metagenome TaxID=256318 RepID=A0A2P2CI07_9ZZZZ